MRIILICDSIVQNLKQNYFCRLKVRANCWYEFLVTYLEIRVKTVYIWSLSKIFVWYSSLIDRIGLFCFYIIEPLSLKNTSKWKLCWCSLGWNKCQTSHFSVWYALLKMYCTFEFNTHQSFTVNRLFRTKAFEHRN